MPTRRIFPNSDQGTNQGNATPAGDHYANVDEYPNDGDTTRLSFSNAGDMEIFGIDVSNIVVSDAIESVTLRAAVSGTSDVSGFKIGFRIGGVNYMSVEQFPAAGSGYQEYAPAAWTTNPATGGSWTRAALASAYLVYEQTTYAGTLPRQRLSSLDGYATTVGQPHRPTSSGAARVPAATSSDPGKPTATAASVVPTATAVVLTPSATGQALVPKGTQS